MKREPSSAGGVLGRAAAGMVVCCGITTLASAGALAALGSWLTNSVVVGVGLMLAGVVVWIAVRRRRQGCAVPEREPLEAAAADESSGPR